MAWNEQGYRGYDPYSRAGYGYDRGDFSADRNRPYGYYGWGYGLGGYGASGYGYGYDRAYRRDPRESPTYGRGADQAARRYADRHGYDAGYTIRPDRTERFGGTFYDRGYRGAGGYGRNGYRGWNEGSYDWVYRW
jgi:hypothetical protein